MLDKLDKKILNALAENGRASIEVIADSVGLSPTPTRRRVKQLEDAGVIKGYRTDIDPENIDPEKCGLEMAIYVFVKATAKPLLNLRGGSWNWMRCNAVI